MKLTDPLRLNEWKFRQFAVISLSLQLAVLGLMTLRLIGVDILIGPLVSFIYLSCMPGYAILRILHIRDHPPTYTLLLAIGLSLMTTMATGFTLNIGLPTLGISRPITIGPYVLAMCVVNLMLLLIAWLRDNDGCERPEIEINMQVARWSMALMLLPILAIYGSQTMNRTGSNGALILLIVALAGIGLLAAFDKIPEKLLPLAVLMVSISLLLHRSLITDYMLGWDIQHEFWIAGIVLNGGHWNPSLPFHTNSMLSIALLAPAYAIFTGLNLIWVFKLAYPLLFSLVPLALFHIYEKQTGSKIAFLSCFLFMAFFVFYGEMLALARQMIAELFLAILLLLIIERVPGDRRHIGLLYLFSVGIIISHYGISFIFSLSLMISCIFLSFEMILHRHFSKNKVIRFFIPAIGSLDDKRRGGHLIGWGLFFFFTGLTLVWSMLFSRGSVFQSVIIIGNSLWSSIIRALGSAPSPEINSVVSSPASPLSTLLLVAQLFVIGLITLSVINTIRRRDDRWNDDFVSLSIAAFAICVLAFALPTFASSLNTTRIYHIALIFLSPFFVTGGMILMKLSAMVVGRPWHSKNDKYYFGTLGAFLAMFLLLNAGVFHSFTDDYTISPSLGYSGNHIRFTTPEIIGGQWMDVAKANNSNYVDHNRWILLNGMSWWEYLEIPWDLQNIEPGSTVYLGKHNVETQSVLVSRMNGPAILQTTLDASALMHDSSRIYNSGQVGIYIT